MSCGAGEQDLERTGAVGGVRSPGTLQLWDLLRVTIGCTLIGRVGQRMFVGVGGGVLLLGRRGLGVVEGVWRRMSDVLKLRVLVRSDSNLQTALTMSLSLPKVETSLIGGVWLAV